MVGIRIARRNHRRKGILVAGAAAVTWLALVQLSAGTGAASLAAVQHAAAAAVPAHGQALAGYGEVPLAFVANAGQSDARVRFQAESGGASFYFTPTEAVFVLAGERKGHVLRLAFVGASPTTEIVGARTRPGRVNYLLGGDPAKWQAGLPTYGEVVYRELWPGIDLAFRGERGALKYEFRVAPGADPRKIRLAYRGADRLSLGHAGDLAVHTSLGPILDSRPISYQGSGDRRVPVTSRYALAGLSYGFSLGSYDRTRPLVIDPGLEYSTFLGGAGSDRGAGIAVDDAGSAYVTGVAGSTNFPTSAGAFDVSANGGGDAFVTKLSPDGADLLYSTYLGGSGRDGDQLHAIAVDAAGSAYVTGYTVSPDFPTTPGAFDSSFNGGQDVFITKLSADGSSLAYSTYAGGSGFDRSFAIAIDAAGSAYVTGFTESPEFPTTTEAFDRTLNGFIDVFVTKLDAAGSALVYSSYVGGSSGDQPRGIAVDSGGSAYVTGFTESANFPTTAGAFDTSRDGTAVDAFVAKLNQDGSRLVYSTYLGGGAGDLGNGIAVDPAGSAYVTGATFSADFPVTVGAFDTSAGGLDAFVTKLNAAGSALGYSTYLGGGGSDNALGIAVDGRGSAYVAGFTTSFDFPTTSTAFDPSANGSTDAVVTKLDVAGAALLYSTYLGGTSSDSADGIAIDGGGGAYVTGLTNSFVFPTTAGAFDRILAGQDAFVTKLSTGSPAPATVTLSPATTTSPVGTSHTVTATVLDGDANALENVVVRFEVTGSVTASGDCTTTANGECELAYGGPAFPGEDVIRAYADSDGDGDADGDEPSGTATKTWVLPPSTPGCTKIADGGRITAASGDKAGFSGNAKVSAAGDPEGQQSYRSRGPLQTLVVTSIDVRAVVCADDGSEATLYGTATIDGAGSVFYRIRVADRARRGKGNDTYGILLDTGYASGDRTLEGGSVRIQLR